MDKPSEILLFDFLSEKVAAAVSTSVLYDLEVHDTIHQTITKPRGLRISEVVGDLSPDPGNVIQEYDVEIVIVCFAKIDGSDKKDRQPALTAVFQIQKEIYRILFAESTLGNRVCESLPRKGSRGYDSWDSQPWAVANIPIVINPRSLGR